MSRLNALHTLPAKLAPASGFWARGKSLVSFYKTGIANVWQNRRLAASIREKYGVASGFELARSVLENSHLAKIEKDVLAKEQQRIAVSRDELLTVLRTEQDFRKLPMFVVIFAVCFEMTPLVLWGFPRIAPSTCWSVSYNQKLRGKYEVTRAEIDSSGLDGSESVFQLPPATLRQLAATLDFGHHYRFVPLTQLRHKLGQHLMIIRADDAILRQEQAHLDELEPEELGKALMARALPLDGGLDALRRWIVEFQEPMDAGFLCKNEKKA